MRIISLYSVTYLLALAAAAQDPPRWTPPPVLSWQWQITGAVQTSVEADVFDLDLYDAPVSVL
jgi:hypothetical protein